MKRNHLIKNETELKEFQEKLYNYAKRRTNENKQVFCKDLFEVISSPVTITTAIHNIKGNKGSKTPGVDGKTITDYLQLDFDEVIGTIQNAMANYSPNMVKRVYIDKPNSKEKRPLGIPTIIDRIIQECVRIVIEPILEAQFFNHSYGFRPYRDAGQAIARATKIISTTGYNWVVEGDIKGFFDNINHRKLLNQLWSMGIKDKRVLMLIKQMLEAGIMGELNKNEKGTPQGGIISPILANVYLHSLDKFVTREWECKQTRHQYSHDYVMYAALKQNSKQKPAYFIRYADDWILITNSKENAEKWKYKIEKFLDNHLKIELSKEKTLITNTLKTHIDFLGIEIKALKRNNLEEKSNKKLITVSRPNRKKVKSKIKQIKGLIRNIKSCRSKEEIIHQTNRINISIRGIIQYYQMASLVNKELAKYSHYLTLLATRYLKKRIDLEIVQANQVTNLRSVHEARKQLIPAIRDGDILIGVTNIGFCSYKNQIYKNPKETPFTREGRLLYRKRTSKIPIKERADELITNRASKIVLLRKTFHNFEYLMNRCYAYNRDKGKCKICGEEVLIKDVNTHHIRPYLPLDQVNKVNNLATLHEACHRMIDSNKDYTNEIGPKAYKKVLMYREKCSKN